MPLPEYYNQNLLNSYPFSQLEANLQPEWFVDCGVVIGAAATWSYANNYVKLHSISATGSSMTVTLRTITTAETIDFVFTFTPSDDRYTTKYADASLGREYGFAFLTCGDLSSAFTSFNQTYTNVRLETTNVTNLSKLFVSGIKVANAYQTLYSDAGCVSLNATVGDGYALQNNGVALTGDITILPGKFVNAAVSYESEVLLIGPSQNIGVSGVPSCSPIRVIPNDYNSSYEPKCSDMVYSFNGITANAESHSFLFMGSPGFEITTVSANQINMLINPAVLFNYGNATYNCSS
jgi:hypothetical protein